MSEARNYDVLVIGTGPSAMSVMNRCNDAGLKVAVAEADKPGGTCGLRGCTPKKALHSPVQAFDWIERMNGHGLHAPEARLDWQDVHDFMKKFIDPIPSSQRKKLKDSGIDLYEDFAKFEGPNQVRVGDTLIEAKHISIDTGARPKPLGIEGEEHVITSDDFFEQEDLPDEILFIGGGYISFEFAHIAARCGRNITIVHDLPHPLVGFDPELSLKLTEWMNEQGMRVVLKSPAKAIRKSASGLFLTVGGESERELRADMIVLAAGRVPNIGGMELEKGDVSFTKEGIEVNEYLQSTSNPAVFAAGDCAATKGAQLTPVAGREGRTVALNIIEGAKHTVNYKGTPQVAFTLPNFAAVGLTVKEATEAGIDFEIHKGSMEKWFEMKRQNARCAGYKMLVDKETNRILGAHLLCPEAAEIINVFALAIRHDITADELSDMLFTYPSTGSNIPRMFG